MSAHIEIVRTDAGPWHARIVAGNGKYTWTTETFKTEQAAVKAVNALGRDMDEWVKAGSVRAEIVDERTDLRTTTPEVRDEGAGS